MGKSFGKEKKVTRKVKDDYAVVCPHCGCVSNKGTTVCPNCDRKTS